MNKNIKIFLNYFLGPLLFVFIAWSLYRQISHQPDLTLRWQEIKGSWNQPRFWLVVVLMILNWGLESSKWQILVRHVQPFSFVNAFKSVLAGCSITMLTPNRVGEYGGRILFVNEKNRVAAIPLTIVGSISQTIVTFAAGIGGIIYFTYNNQNFPFLFSGFSSVAINILLSGSIVILLLLTLFYINIGWMAGLMLKLKIPMKYVKYALLLNSIPGKELLRIMALSFMRYMVFILQFILLLFTFNVKISFVACFWILTVFYLVMALAPTIGLTELPVRSLTGVELLSNFSNNILGIQVASLTIWLINLVIPAVVGSILIIGIKIMKDR